MTVQKPQQQSEQQTQQGSEQRSENLLPADDAPEGSLEVAEEVNLDQQSDASRRVGQVPKGVASDGLADSLAGKDEK